jgi:ketosteroid isomerase-like protein
MRPTPSCAKLPEHGAAERRARAPREIIRRVSSSNVEVVRRFIEAVESKDFAAALRLIDPDVDWFPTEGGTYHGLQGVADAFAAWMEPWGEHRITIEEVTEIGDQVLATIHIVARGEHTGIETDKYFFQLHTLREGRISRMVEYVDRAQAISAAGEEP